MCARAHHEVAQIVFIEHATKKHFDKQHVDEVFTMNGHCNVSSSACCTFFSQSSIVAHGQAPRFAMLHRWTMPSGGVNSACSKEASKDPVCKTANQEGAVVIKATASMLIA